MAPNDKNRNAQWSRIVTELLQDLAETGDTELFEEFRARGLDPVAEAERIRRIALDAVTESGKQRLSNARAELRNHLSSRSGQMIDVSPDKARRIMAALRSSARGEHVTLAARKAGELTDSDVLEIVKVLFKRGIIDADGNLT